MLNNINYWVMFVLHNLIAHPLLIVGKIADKLELNSVEKFFTDLHDQTYPER